MKIINIVPTLCLIATVLFSSQANAQMYRELGDLDFNDEVSFEDVVRWVESPDFTEWLRNVPWDQLPVLDGEPCPNLGIEWTSARVVHSGGVHCADRNFTISLGADDGGQVVVQWIGCPTFIDIEIGHGKVVAKTGFRKVHRQLIPWQRQAYVADCDAPSCVPDGVPTELPTTVEHWAEEPCSPPDPGGGGGAGPGGGTTDNLID